MHNLPSHVYKEANRLYWSVKGMLIPTDWSRKDVLSVYNGYTARVWGNHEAMTDSHMSGFPEAWELRKKELNIEDEWPDFVDGDLG